MFFKDILEKLLIWVEEKFGAKSLSSVDLTAELNERAKGTGLRWQISVVDFLKLIGADSSSVARAKLGKELGIEGKPGEAMYNDRLRKALFEQLRQNGGNVPDNLIEP